jgi:hypothetical protein
VDVSVSVVVELMAMSKPPTYFWYTVNDPGDADERYRVKYNFSLSGLAGDLLFAAEEAAEDYYSAHDGWESSWPLTFVFYDSEDGPEIGRCEVECESVPSFHARTLELN